MMTTSESFATCLPVPQTAGIRVRFQLAELAAGPGADPVSLRQTIRMSFTAVSR